MTTWDELRQAAEVLVDEGGSMFPLALVEAIARVEEAQPGTSSTLVDELRRRFGPSPYDQGTEREVIEWLRSR